MVKKPKVKIKNESNEKLDLMIVNKCPLKNICKDDNLLEKINEHVLQSIQNLFGHIKKDYKNIFYFNIIYAKIIFV